MTAWERYFLAGRKAGCPKDQMQNFERADLVLLKANPLLNIRHSSALAGVMVAGRWLSRAELEERLNATAPVPLEGDATTYGTRRLLMQWARAFLWH